MSKVQSPKSGPGLPDLPALSRATLTGWRAVMMMVLIATGCATAVRPTPSTPHPTGLFPPSGLITQRATLTVRGRQFALTGYVALDATQGRRLIVTELFGHVLADVLVKRDGSVFVMRSSPMLRPAWIRRYLAADLECIFGGTPEAGCPVRMPEENHFLIERRWYKLDVRTVETRPGRQSAEMFDETRAEKP